MPARVQKHVRQRIADFTGRTQDPSVKPFREDGTSAIEHPVQRACDARADRHHAAPEGIGVGRFDEQVRVCGLHGVVNERELTAVAGRGKAPLEGADERDGA